jgi:hypothetical protein
MHVLARASSPVKAGLAPFRVPAELSVDLCAEDAPLAADLRRRHRSVVHELPGRPTADAEILRELV